MSFVLSYPGTMAHAQNAALAMMSVGGLKYFLTTLTFREDRAIAAALKLVPPSLAEPVWRELHRRSVSAALDDKLRTYPGWEILRTLLGRAGASPVAADLVWDLGVRRFDEWVARSHVPGCGGVVAFEYSALATFRRAKSLGLPTVLHLPSLDSLAFKKIEDRERGTWPELHRPTDGYFERKFSKRYERRLSEIALADVIIANSALTRRSHVAAGADPEKVFVARLGGPAPVAKPAPRDDLSEPLTVLWSGTFSLGKGAHYLVAAWRRLNPRGAARLLVYGKMAVPSSVLQDAPDGIEFLGSVPHAAMLQAFEGADVLIFPTLSDGFGMVVSEALSRGVPVITTDQAGAADLIRPGENGLIVPSGDELAIRDALQWCLDNRRQLNEMRWPALKAARENQWSRYHAESLDGISKGLARRGFSFPSNRKARGS